MSDEGFEHASELRCQRTGRGYGDREEARYVKIRMVGDFSSLIFLSALGLPDLLRIKFGEVPIPEAAYQEVTAANLKGHGEVK